MYPPALTDIHIQQPLWYVKTCPKQSIGTITYQVQMKSNGNRARENKFLPGSKTWRYKFPADPMGILC